MYIAWTSVAELEDAERLASEIITRHLAACVQIEGPLKALYRWEGRIESAAEYRLCIKCLESQLSALETYILRHHPYSIPEWVVTRADHVAEKYLSWAVSVSKSSTL